MRLLVRTLGCGPVPQAVQVDENLSVQALLEQLFISDKISDASGERPRLVYHGQVLREGSKLRDLLGDGDVVVLLAGRRVASRPPVPPSQASKGPNLREINAAIREDLARQGPGRLAAAEAAVRRQAHEAPPQREPSELLSEVLMTGELGALRAYLEQLQQAMRMPNGGNVSGGDGAGDAGLPAALALEALFGQLGGQQGLVGSGGRAAAAEAPHNPDDDLGTHDDEGEEEGEFSETEDEGEEEEEYADEDDEEEDNGEEAGLGLDDQQLPPQVPDLDSPSLAALMDMGFPEALCRNALLWGCNRFEPALEWLLGHAEDPAAAEPLSNAQLARLYGRGPPRQGMAADQSHLAHLMDMGFEHQQAEQALRAYNNSLPAAASWLLNVGATAAAAPAAAAGGEGGAGPSGQQAGEVPSAAGWASGGSDGEEEVSGEEDGSGKQQEREGMPVLVSDASASSSSSSSSAACGSSRAGELPPPQEQHEEPQAVDEEDAMPQLLSDDVSYSSEHEERLPRLPTAGEDEAILERERDGRQDG